MPLGTDPQYDREILLERDIHALNGRGYASEEPEPVDDTYWAKRGSVIQQIYHRWDCNELSSEAFLAQLQEILGESVDVTGPESECQRLVSKHAGARNMRFASFSSAMRRDAQITMGRRLGRPVLPSAPSMYAASFPGPPSNYEPSEVGSEAPSTAAGRPTSSASIPASVRGGRRHFAASDNKILAPVQESVPSRPRPAATPPPWAHQAPSAAPVVRSKQPIVDMSDAVSVVSDLASEADSQRAVHTHRNRTGHGNILTWGNDSRNITPEKQRQARFAADRQMGLRR